MSFSLPSGSGSSAPLVPALPTLFSLHAYNTVCLLQLSGCLMQGKSGLTFPISPAVLGAAALLPLASAVCSH